jgi:hypothetical protein
MGAAVAGGGRPGRPESPLNPENGAAAGLAAQLRQLREEAGRPSYRQLARSAYYSHSALSQAAAGRVLPSLAVTLAFVEACGGDPQEWTARWQAAAAPGVVTASPEAPAASLEDPAASPEGPAPGGETATAAGRGIRARPDRIRRASWRRLSLAGWGAAAVAGCLWAWSSYGGTTPQVVPRPAGGLSAPVFDGASPDVAGCDTGSGELGSRSVLAGNGVLLGTVELRYSRRCAAVWARFVPSPALSGAGAVVITLKLVRRPDGRTEASSLRYTGQRQRSDLLLLHAGCAQGSVKITRSGRALASATTACLASR